MSTSAIICVLCIGWIQTDSEKAIQFKTRIKDSKTNENEALDSMQVSVFVTGVTVRPKIVPGSDNRPVELGPEVNVHEKTYRLQIADEGKRRRLDGLLATREDALQVHHIEEHLLIRGDELLYVNGLPRIWNPRKSERQQNATFDVGVLTGKLSPFQYSWGTYISDLAQQDVIPIVEDMKIVEVANNEDKDNEFIVVSRNHLRAIKYFFDSDIPWMLRKSEFYHNGSNQDATAEIILKSWDRYGITTTEWEKCDNSIQVPKKISISYDYNNDEAQYEMYFRNWKFGKDVDERSFSEEWFVEERVRMIRFDEIRKDFADVEGVLTPAKNE